MERGMRTKRQHEQGFTLALTIMLTVVLSLAAVAIMTKVFVSMRQSGFTKEHQNTMDAAVIGLNMAIDEISPGMDRMRNAVWTSAVSPYSPVPAAPSLYPPVAMTQTQFKTDGASTDTPVRELGLVGNIRNWDGFANWSGATKADWNRGWEYVASASTPYQFFDAAPGQTGKATVSIGNVNTTGAYWYKQIEPKPPTLAEGAPDVPTLPNGTKVWPNARGGTFGNEYPYGLFCQPVLRKVYQVRQNPVVRVAVYVRMSLQDYYGPEIVNGKVVYKNVHLDGRTIPVDGNVPGMDNASASYDGRNFYDTNAVTFSVFAVSEGTAESKGVRIHQALNITLGGAEYLSGLSKRVYAGKELNANGLENADRLREESGDPAYPQNYLSPYFSPSLDTPSGNSQLTAFAPINGQVYPASTDLSFRFDTRAATEQAVFLYEQIKLGRASGDTVVFLIEQIPRGVSGAAAPYWRRRLLYDYPGGYSSPLWGLGGEVPRYQQMMFNRASYSSTVDPWASTIGFPSMLWWANREGSASVGTHANMIPATPVEEHFYNKGNLFTDYTDQRYPYSAQVNRFGNFAVGTRSAGEFGVPTGDPKGDVVVWKNPPLLDYKGTRLAESMPWQGPTVPVSQAEASVSYVTTTWPKNAWSGRWLSQGGGIGIPFTAATWSVR